MSPNCTTNTNTIIRMQIVILINLLVRILVFIIQLLVFILILLVNTNTYINTITHANSKY